MIAPAAQMMSLYLRPESRKRRFFQMIDDMTEAINFRGQF